MKIPPRPDSSHQEDGFSLSLVLVASLMVLLGGLMLVDRASDGVISAAFQREGSDARDAAETGMTRIVGELNRPQNRGLLAKQTSGDDPASYRWKSGDPASSINSCLGPATGTPDLSDNLNLGFVAEGDGNPAPAYARVLLDKDGKVVTDINQATKAYRLLWVKRQPLTNTDGNQLLKIFQPTGRGKVTLAVEGSALRNGQTLSSVRLEEELQLVPKCCGQPFGGKHGNVDYGTGSNGASVCFGANWGFVGGAAGDNNGYIKINGVTTITTGGTDPQPVNPLTCIADSTAQCSFDPTSTSYTLQTSPIRLPPIYTFIQPDPPAALVGLGRIERTGGSLSPSIEADASAFASCHSSDLINVSDLASTIVPECKAAETTTVVLNAAISDTAIEKTGYCAKYMMPESATIPGSNRQMPGDDKVGLHCKLGVLDYSAFNIVVINTDEIPLRLYFPNAGAVVSSGGGKTLKHDLTDSAGNVLGKMTDLALFGCASCDSQTVSLAGGVSSLDLWAWFPQGTVTISGGSNYSGVLWADRIVSNGGVTWTVPGSGVAQAMEVIGYGVPADTTSTSDNNPLVFDWVARAVERFRWFGR